MTHQSSLQSAIDAGLSVKSAGVYLALLEAGSAISPKALIQKSRLHRQYVYDALYELGHQGLVDRLGTGKLIRYQAVSPEKLLEQAEKRRIDAFGGVQELMKIYDRSPAGVVEVIRGTKACIESEFRTMREAEPGDFLDIVGGAGMSFVNLFKGQIADWEFERNKKNIKLRYIGSGDDVKHNRTQSVIKNESRTIPGIGNIVNVCIRPKSVSFNIYEPEVMTVRVRSIEAVNSQRALFEVLWGVASE